MEIVKVRAEHAQLFSGVAPEDVLGMLSLPNCGAIGAVEDKKGIGLLVFTGQKDSITIEWLYVDEDYRGIGAGAELVENAFMIAEKLGAERLLLRLPEDENFEGLQLYFMEWGFGWRKTFPGDWEFTVKEGCNTQFGKKALTIKGDIPNISPLSKVPHKDIKVAAKKAEEEGRTILYDIDKNRNFLDQELSVVCSYKGIVKGMLLFHRADSVIYPVVLWAENDNSTIIANLIGSAVRSTVRSAKLTDVVRIISGSDRTGEYLEQVLPDIKPRTIVMMQADTDALERILNEDIDSSLDGAFRMKDLFSPEDIPSGGFTVVDFEAR